mmetsp:Transcript_34330/g.110477  ORF Transcript_34330/g.110477 Transcript_34330/m.110477 type:complete len:230 (-) Transcript_34330:344-1033(-)
MEARHPSWFSLSWTALSSPAASCASTAPPKAFLQTPCTWESAESRSTTAEGFAVDRACTSAGATASGSPAGGSSRSKLARTLAAGATAAGFFDSTSRSRVGTPPACSIRGGAAAARAREARVEAAASTISPVEVPLSYRAAAGRKRSSASTAPPATSRGRTAPCPPERDCSSSSTATASRSAVPPSTPSRGLSSPRAASNVGRASAAKKASTNAAAPASSAGSDGDISC